MKGGAAALSLSSIIESSEQPRWFTIDRDAIVVAVPPASEFRVGDCIWAKPGARKVFGGHVAEAWQAGSAEGVFFHSGRVSAVVFERRGELLYISAVVLAEVDVTTIDALSASASLAIDLLSRVDADRCIPGRAGVDSRTLHAVS